MQYQPLEDRVVIRPIKEKEQEKTESGIILDMVKKEVREGEVISIGSGRYANETGVFMPTVLHKGDMVVFGSSTGLPITIDAGEGKEEALIMREGDILILIKKSE